jgi:hypothetical protein
MSPWPRAPKWNFLAGLSGHTFARIDPCFADEATRRAALMHCDGANILKGKWFLLGKLYAVLMWKVATNFRL